MRRALTIVEVLVVLLVIAVVAILLIPGPSRMRPEAWKSACRGNLHNIGLAVQMYLNDSNGLYPGEGDGPSPDLDTTEEIFGSLYPTYIDMTDLFQCPAVGTPVQVTPSGLTGGDYLPDPAIESQTDPAVAIWADASTKNHGDGSIVLFADAHVRWCPENAGAPGAVPSSDLWNADTDIYASGAPAADPLLDAWIYRK